MVQRKVCHTRMKVQGETTQAGAGCRRYVRAYVGSGVAGRLTCWLAGIPVALQQPPLEAAEVGCVLGAPSIEAAFPRPQHHGEELSSLLRLCTASADLVQHWMPHRVGVLSV